MANTTETIRAQYVPDKCGFSNKHGNRYLSGKGICPILIAGAYHYQRNKVDMAQATNVNRSRSKPKKKALLIYFKFSEFQIEVVNFFRGDYTYKTTKVRKLKPSQHVNYYGVHLEDRNDYVPPHSGFILFGLGGYDLQLLAPGS